MMINPNTFILAPSHTHSLTHALSPSLSPVRFVCKNNGVLFENQLLQIGIKSEYRQNLGEFGLQDDVGRCLNPKSHWCEFWEVALRVGLKLGFFPGSINPFHADQSHVKHISLYAVTLLN